MMFFVVLCFLNFMGLMSSWTREDRDPGPNSQFQAWRH